MENMIQMPPRCDAEILPNIALGGVELRTPIQRYFLQLIHRQKCMSNLFEASYDFGCIEMAVDIRIGKITRITGDEAYTGRLFGSIGTGMTVAQVTALDPRIYYDDTEIGLLVRGVRGVVLEIDDEDPDPEILPLMRITKISVYAVEYMHTNSIHGITETTSGDS